MTKNKCSYIITLQSKQIFLIQIGGNYNENSKAIHGVQILYRHDDAKDLVAVMQSKFNQELGVINDEIKSE